MPDSVQVSLQANYIEIPAGHSETVTNCFPLGQKVTVCEQYLLIDYGLYKLTLSLSKEVEHSSEVQGAEEELVHFLVRLCWIWHLTGGMMIKYEQVVPHSERKYVSNAKSVACELLSKEGWTCASASIPISWVAKHVYKRLPLETAVKVMIATAGDLHFWSLVEYLYLSIVDTEKWFVHLYKIRDCLKSALKAHYDATGGVKGKLEDSIISDLRIDPGDWSDFGRLLNVDYNLRHPRPDARTDVSIPPDLRTRLEALGKAWVLSYGSFKKYGLIG